MLASCAPSVRSNWANAADTDSIAHIHAGYRRHLPMGVLIRSSLAFAVAAFSGRVARALLLRLPFEGNHASFDQFHRGESVAPKAGKYAELINPSTGEPFAETPVSDASDIDAALQVAAKAFESWKRTTPAERSMALLKIADVFEAHAEELVAVEAENCGKIIGVTMQYEMPPMIDQIRFYAGAARLLEGRGAAEYMQGMTSYVRREPIGVCGAVTPWNYPMMMPCGSGTGARGGQHHGAQAQRHDAGLDAADGGIDVRRLPCGSVQRRVRRPRDWRGIGRAFHSGDGVDHRFGAAVWRSRVPRQRRSSGCTLNLVARLRSSSSMTRTSPLRRLRSPRLATTTPVRTALRDSGHRRAKSLR